LVAKDPWQIEVLPAALRDAGRLDPPIRKRVRRGIEALANDPLSSPKLLPLKGRDDHRLRVGDWRVLLHLDEATRTITVRRILPRGRAYER